MGIFSVVVNRHEQALAVRDGVLEAVLGPGRHRRRSRTTYERIDVRDRVTAVATQEILTGDGVTVKISVALRWSVSDAAAYTAVSDPLAVVYLAVQIALREQVVGQDAMVLIREGRQLADAALRAAAEKAAAPVGIRIRSVVIKDIVLPSELRTAYAELVSARQRGLAQLESARSESAALRSMANAAKLLDDHPALAQLRLVQAAPYGSKLVLEVGDRRES